VQSVSEVVEELAAGLRALHATSNHGWPRDIDLATLLAVPAT
jgi:hypothetical protein